MLSQRIYDLALAHEDINDHEQLRNDSGVRRSGGPGRAERPLAGKSTLDRMELSSGTSDRYKKITVWKEALDELLVEVFLESYQQVVSTFLCKRWNLKFG